MVSITVNGKYRVDATINQQNLLQRIHTWVADPVLGDMNYEHEFTNDSYVDLGNGIRFPTGWHSHQGWDDNYGAQNVTAGHNAFGGTLKDVRANQCPASRPRCRPRCSRRHSRSGVETTEAGRRRLPARRRIAQQHRGRVQGLHCRLRSAARRRAQPRRHRDHRQADPGQADSLGDQLASAFRSRRRPAHLHAHRRDHHHALEELRLLQSRRADLRAADGEAGHGVAMAADRARRGLLLRDHPRELHHQRRHAEPERPLRQPAPARRRAC